MQYFIWGSWLVTLSSYMINTLHFTGAEVGIVYSANGIAALLMPSIIGIIADKWVVANRLFASVIWYVPGSYIMRRLFRNRDSCFG